VIDLITVSAYSALKSVIYIPPVISKLKRYCCPARA